MKYLTQFLSFDFNSFAKGKKFVVAGISEYKDFHTKVHLGTTVDIAIVADNTNYKSSSGETASNLFEKFKVKVAKDITLNMNEEVKIINPVATVYGDYKNQLSVKADNVIPVVADNKHEA